MAANYPTNNPTNGSLLIAANNVSSTLNGGLSAIATSATLASTTHFPSAGGITIESEAIIYTANDTATAVLSGISRGVDSTTAAIHADGTAVYMNWQARHHNQSKDEIIAIGTDLKSAYGRVYGATSMDTALNELGTTYKNNTSTATNFPATNVHGDLASMSLSAGTFLITGVLRANAATGIVTNLTVGVSTTPGDTITGLVTGDNYFSMALPTMTANENMQLIVPAHAVGTTTGGFTVYLKYLATYSSGQPTATGRISAVKIK